MKIVCIFNLGTSDITVNPRQADFVNVEEGELREGGVIVRGKFRFVTKKIFERIGDYVQPNDIEKLKEVLKFDRIISKINKIQQEAIGSEVYLYLICSNQRENNSQDTIFLGKIIKYLREKKVILNNVKQVKIKEIVENPSDYRKMMEIYNEIVKDIIGENGEKSTYVISVDSGTPQQNMGLALNFIDKKVDVKEIYVPRVGNKTMEPIFGKILVRPLSERFLDKVINIFIEKEQYGNALDVYSLKSETRRGVKNVLSALNDYINYNWEKAISLANYTFDDLEREVIEPLNINEEKRIKDIVKNIRKMKLLIDKVRKEFMFSYYLIIKMLMIGYLSKLILHKLNNHEEVEVLQLVRRLYEALLHTAVEIAFMGVSNDTSLKSLDIQIPNLKIIKDELNRLAEKYNINERISGSNINLEFLKKLFENDECRNEIIKEIVKNLENNALNLSRNEMNCLLKILSTTVFRKENISFFNSLKSIRNNSIYGHGFASVNLEDETKEKIRKIATSICNFTQRVIDSN